MKENYYLIFEYNEYLGNATARSGREAIEKVLKKYKLTNNKYIYYVKQ